MTQYESIRKNIIYEEKIFAKKSKTIVCVDSPKEFLQMENNSSDV